MAFLFSVSLPVGYYNMDMMKKAGIEKLPTTWEEVINACKVMKSKGIKNPVFWGWNITGNWFLQALMWSQNAPTMDGNKFNVAGPEGIEILRNNAENL